MEGKSLRIPFGTIFLAVLILSLVVAKTQVEARVCCQGPWGRACYQGCAITPLAALGCVSTCGCREVSGSCPSGYQNSISPLRKSAGAINDYCKLGCASSVYNAITTLQNSGENFVNEAVEQCTNACISAIYTKGSFNAFEIA